MRNFDGEDIAEARVWLSEWKKYIGEQTMEVAQTNIDGRSARLFAAHIEEGSHAETWWNGLTNAQQASHATILIQFNTEWPAQAARPPTIEENIDEFESHMFPADDIGLRVPTGVGSKTQYSHTLYAETLRKLGAKTTLPAAALILRAKKQIPQALVDCMDGHDDESWPTWCKKLGEVRMSTLTSKQQLYSRLESVEQHAARTQTPAHPPPARQAQPTAWQTRTTRPAPQEQRAAAPVYATPQPTPYQQQPAPTQQPADIWAAPPPSTPLSIARVEGERRAWAERFPDGRPFTSRAYPLTPGTAPAAVGCARCGAPETPEHSQYKCNSGSPLPELEQRYRANVVAARERATASAGHGRGAPQPMTPGAMSPTPWRGRGRGIFASPGTPSPVHHIAAAPPAAGHSAFEEVDYSTQGDEPEDESGNGVEVTL